MGVHYDLEIVVDSLDRHLPFFVLLLLQTLAIKVNK